MGPVGHYRDEPVAMSACIESHCQQISDDTGIDEGVVDSNEKVHVIIGVFEGCIDSADRPDSRYFVFVASREPGMVVLSPNSIHCGANLGCGFDNDIDEPFSAVQK